jgi:hypothetical protein
MLRSARLALVLLLIAASVAQAQWTSSRPDGHAPYGVMMDHTHEAGEAMFSYRYVYMQMNGLRDGTENITANEVLTDYGYPVTPTDMTGQMHMFGLMFAPSDNLTLMGMVPVKALSMDHATRAVGPFTTSSSGFGDIKLAGMWNLPPVGDQRIHLNLMLSFPTGSINKRDATPAGEVRLPYPMQIGSGTFDLTPGLTYLGQSGDWSWGGQGLTTFRLGENDNGYRLGHRYMATGWGARRVNRWLSGSIRLDWTNQENVEGADPQLDPEMVPTADPNLQGFQRWSVGFGINTYVRGGTLQGLRIAGEWVVPFYQDLDGPQLETDWYIVIGVQYTGVVY